MREIRKSGSMSGDGKRDHDAPGVQSTRARPRLYPPDGRSTREARHYFVALARRAHRGVKYASLIEGGSLSGARLVLAGLSRASAVRWVESRTGAGALDARALLVPFPVPAHRTGRADFPHPALRPASPRGPRSHSHGSFAPP